MQGLTEQDALLLVARHLGDSSRARHSIFVGTVMARLAVRLEADPLLWQTVGPCHDLDYNDTRATPARHGPLAAEWLQDLLPPEALSAIAAHDHRAGITDASQLATALRLADALAVICETMGERALSAFASPQVQYILNQEFPNRAYLPAMVQRAAAEIAIPLPSLAQICRDTPPPA